MIAAIRQQVPGIALRTTMLVGFPGETESDVAELIEFLKEMKFERVGVFTYSAEEGTTGYALKDTLTEEKNNSGHRAS